MHSDEIRNTIENWTEWAKSTNNYDIALLKIWIKFEKYLGEVFINYSLGNASERQYLPELKICFEDETQFNAFMLEGSKKYVEYIKKIEKLSKYIFRKNPFDIILKDVDRKNLFEQMRAIRNYIVHESEESKRKLINICFDGKEERFIEPNDFLKRKSRNNEKSYYTLYIELIYDVIEGVNEEIDA